MTVLFPDLIILDQTQDMSALSASALLAIRLRATKVRLFTDGDSAPSRKHSDLRSTRHHFKANLAREPSCCAEADLRVYRHEIQASQS
jgi:hypothetical protein